MGLGAAAPAAAADDRPTIEDLAINDGAETTSALDVRLVLRVTGNVDSYRASEDRRLLGATWQPFAAEIPFHLGADGGADRTVYVQIRRNEHVSRVASQSIRYLPPHREYELPLSDARILVRPRGWEFSQSPANPVSICAFDSSHGEMVLTARRKRPATDGICDFVLFGSNHRLMPGWRFLRFERTRDDVGNCQFRFFEFPAIEGDRITFRMRIIDRAARGRGNRDDQAARQGCTYRISRIVLQGPPDLGWQDAFPR